jgi:hypothetical protein
MAGTCWCGGKVADVRLGGQGATCTESVFHDPLSNGRPQQVRTVYVAGPMSGYPENNYPAFHEAAERLREAGYAVVNPAEYGGPTEGRFHYVDLLREDLRQMLDAQGVCTLDNWWESTGARNEVNVAGLLKMPVRSLVEWLERAHQELSPVLPTVADVITN